MVRKGTDHPTLHYDGSKWCLCKEMLPNLVSIMGLDSTFFTTSLDRFRRQNVIECLCDAVAFFI